MAPRIPHARAKCPRLVMRSCNFATPRIPHARARSDNLVKKLTRFRLTRIPHARAKCPHFPQQSPDEHTFFYEGGLPIAVGECQKPKDSLAKSSGNPHTPPLTPQHNFAARGSIIVLKILRDEFPLQLKTCTPSGGLGQDPSIQKPQCF